LYAVGPVSLEQTFGNLNARQVGGELNVQAAKGNVRIRQVGGTLTLGQVDGNLIVEGMQGDLAADNVRGNIRLGAPFPAGTVHRLNCAGNLIVHLPVEADLALTLSASGGVRSTIPDLDLEEDQGQVRGVIGTGAANLEARVSGYVFLLPAELNAGAADTFDSDLNEWGTLVEGIVARALAKAEARLKESLERVGSGDDRRGKRAVEKARQAARKTEQARMRAERAERRWRRASGRRTRSKRDTVTDEELMRILRLVEEEKITPEQAADLLAALNGQ